MLRIAICALFAACTFTPPEVRDDDDTPGPMACETGTHACGSECMPDQANTPDVGCSQGCGVACPTVANAGGACTADGTCEIQCVQGFAEIGGACVPNVCEDAGFTCGTFVDDADASFDCGSCESGVACGTDHQCAIGADAQEPNNSLAEARNLGEFDDAANRVHDLAELTIANGDEDWFRFHISDGVDGGNPIGFIQVRDPVAPGHLASDHELTVWFACDSSDAGSIIECGEANTIRDRNSINDPTLGIGCTLDARQVVWAQLRPSCSSASDGGIVTMRIRKLDAPRGDRYLLRTIVE